MKRSFLVIAFTAALVALTGFLGTFATSASASPPKLKAMLLSIGQMPTGWSLDNSFGGKVPSVATRTMRCRRASSRPRSATANFQGKGGFPAVGEKLATFTNATASYNEAVANLVDCKHFSGTSGGEKVTGGTVEQMSFPHYGNASDAFVVIFTISGMRFYQDLLYVRKGSIVMAFFEGTSVRQREPVSGLCQKGGCKASLTSSFGSRWSPQRNVPNVILWEKLPTTRCASTETGDSSAQRSGTGPTAAISDWR